MATRKIWYSLMAIVLPLLLFSQQKFTIAGGKNTETVKFKLVNNLIILPVKVNGVQLSFILDSGVNKPILFNLTESDSLEVKNIEEIFLKGLGDGDPIKAFRSRGNLVAIEKAISVNQDIFIVLDQGINFSPRVGFPVHGIIGYDIFRDFVVEINYGSKSIKLHNPETYKYRNCDKCETLPIEVSQSKAFLTADIEVEENKSITAKLLIDTGSSDALWLFKNEEKQLQIPDKSFEDFLGRGLSGSIFGSRTRVKSLRLGGFELNNAKAAFPDSLSIVHLKNFKNRDGSVGAEVLKRFNIIFDYPQGKVTLKKNGNFKAPFKYNMSGVEIQHNGLRLVREFEGSFGNIFKDPNDTSGAIQIFTNKFKMQLYPLFEIAEIRPNSPAELAGLRKGDILISVNRKPTYRYSLQEVSEYLNEADGKLLRLVVERDGKELIFSFELQDPLK